jgi:hypothetical protein
VPLGKVGGVADGTVEVQTRNRCCYTASHLSHIKELLMKKTLLTALMVTGISQAQAAPYINYFYDSSPIQSKVTITLSGYCSGEIVDTVMGVSATVSDNPASQTSYAESTAAMLGMNTGNYFYGRSVGSSTSISNKKGVLSIALKDTSSYGLIDHFSRVHQTSADSVVSCKNGQTLNTILSNLNGYSAFIKDKTLTNNISFTLKGSAEPFDYKYAQTVTGYLELPTVCTNTGLFTGTGNIATDTFTSSCKMVNKVKVKMSITASGQIHYT